MSGNHIDTDPEGFLTDRFIVDHSSPEEKNYEDMFIPYLNSKAKYSFNKQV